MRPLGPRVSRDPATATDPGAVEIIRRTRAMATDIVVRAVHLSADPAAVADALGDALALFGDVEAACTRFDPRSPLMRANACPTVAHRMPPLCFEALREASRFYEETGGMFDPRILGDLQALGYERSLPFSAGDVEVSGPPVGVRRTLPPWRPRFWAHGCRVVLGPHPVDLGGIGKGLAVRWASRALGRSLPDHLVEAGGDCYCSGSAPDGNPWLIAVEDPFGDPVPRAVLALRDLGCATSSTRLRRWRRNGELVHHIVDPRSGRPADGGLSAVTVVTADPAEAEVWAKVLFLAGRVAIGAVADENGLAALWVDEDGVTGASSAMGPLLQWGPR